MPQAHIVRIIRTRHPDSSCETGTGVKSMMGHLVFGRYGRYGASPARASAGWLWRIWQNVVHALRH